MSAESSHRHHHHGPRERGPKGMVRRFLLPTAAVFAVWVAVFELARAFFCLRYTESALGPMVHGFAMDCSVAAYLTVIPMLLLFARSFTHSAVLRMTLRAVLAVEAFLASAAIVVDFMLYGHWGFRLDATPLFYLLTAPGSAVASVTPFEAIVGVVATLFGAVLIWWLLRRVIHLLRQRTHRLDFARPMLWAPALLLAVLFLLMRGGLTVATMNPSRAYYTTDSRLNHAALNPMFSFMYSATHQSRYGDSYRAMKAIDARDEVARLFPADDACPPALDPLPEEVYVIILESFSSHLMPSLGGDDVAAGIDALASEGWNFTNFYANSFRTDRALPAILSGLPSQPTASIMKDVGRAEHLPSIAKQLRSAGYASTYYYGGDASFTNMQAYLRATGFGRIVSEDDFGVRDRLSKWGAHDDVLLRRVADEARAGSRRPQLRVVQTSSSHEPFDVPYRSARFADAPRRNAFAFTDSVVSGFVRGLQADTARWNKTLVVLVADHYGCWPPRESLERVADRHHIPLVMLGGALGAPRRIATVGSQNDLAATLMCLLGADPSVFPFSNNLLSPSAAGVAWIAETDLVALADSTGRLTVVPLTAPADEASRPARALLQKLYDYLDEL